MIFSIVFIGLLVSFFSVYTITIIYKYKNTNKATAARIIGISIVSLVVVLIQYALENYLLINIQSTLNASLIFTGSAIIGLIIFFWLYRNRIK